VYTDIVLRYVGLGATMSVMDICTPFRERINHGLEKKGYSAQNTFLGLASPASGNSTSRAGDFHPEQTSALCYGDLPPPALIKILTDCFYNRLHYIVPVISEKDFRAQLSRLTSAREDAMKSDFVPVMYSIFALAAFLISHDHQDSSHEVLSDYGEVNLASMFFELATTSPQSGFSQGGQTSACFTQAYPRRTLNTVIAAVLQVAYLATLGSQADAWILIGQAARLGQDLGLHVSTSLI
jgi:hypothetical protein